jgi:hypothetical protein
MTFSDEMNAALKLGFAFPDAFLKLYRWVETTGFIGTYPTGGRFGTLAPLAFGIRGSPF